MAVARVLPKTKTFQGKTESAAVEAAKRWSADLSSHDAVKVEEIVATKKGTDKFFATISYRET